MAKYLVETDQGKFEIETEDPSPSHPDFMPVGGEKSFAEQASKAVTPPVPGTQDNSPVGLVNRAWNATKEVALAPVAPFIPGLRQRLFNPNMGQAGPSQVLEQAGRQVGGAVRSSGINAAEQLATSPLGQRFPKTSAAIGATGSTLADVASDSLTPSAMQQQIGAEGMSVAAPEALRVASKVAEDVAQSAGRRALGFIKSQLKTTRGGVERANAVAQEALDKGVITPLAGPKTMLDRAESVAQAGKGDALAVVSALDKAKAIPEVNALDLADKVQTQLRDVIGKGAPTADQNAVDEIVNRIVSNGDEKTGQFTFSSLQRLKELLQSPSKSKWLATSSDAVKSDLYRRASGIVNAELRKAIGSSARGLPEGGELLKKYLAGNLTSGKGADAARTLADRVSREAGNKFINPFDQTAGLGGLMYSLSTGRPDVAVKTLALIAGKKAVDSFGPQTVAKGADVAAKSAVKLAAAIERARPGLLATLQRSAQNELDNRQAKEFVPIPSQSPKTQKPSSLNLFGPPSASASVAIPAQSKFPVSQPDSLYAQAYGHFLKGDNQKAADLAYRAIQNNPNNMEAKMMLERLSKQGNYGYKVETRVTRSRR